MLKLLKTATVTWYFNADKVGKKEPEEWIKQKINKSQSCSGGELSEQWEHQTENCR